MNTPSFFCDCLGAKTRKCFLSFQENNFAGNQEMFSNPSGSEVPVWEGRVPLGSKISELSDGKIIQEELSVGRNISYELSDRQNYQRRRGIIWKLGRIKFFSSVSSFHHLLLLDNGLGSLEKKMLLKDSLRDRVWSRQEYENIWISIFRRKSFSSLSPSLENCHTVLLCCSPDSSPNSNYWFPRWPGRTIISSLLEIH